MRQVVYNATPTQNTRTNLDIIESWNPKRLPVHCANCLHCKVSEDGLGLAVHCAKGYGQTKPLSTVIRGNNPRGFRSARNCPDFIGMGK